MDDLRYFSKNPNRRRRGQFLGSKEVGLYVCLGLVRDGSSSVFELRCDGDLLRNYCKAIGGASWVGTEDYMSSRTITFYTNSLGRYADIELPYAGRALVQIDANPDPVIVYTDMRNWVVLTASF